MVKLPILEDVEEEEEEEEEEELIRSLLFHCRLRRNLRFGTPEVFFSLEKKRNNVQDSDNRDFHIIVLDTYPYAGGD